MDNQSQTSWKKKQKEQLREEFIAAAARLFRANGFDAVSVDDIVSATGVAKGTFYLYFKTKADIVQAVLEKSLRELDQRTSAALANSSEGTGSSLLAVVAAQMSFLQENPGMLALLVEVESVYERVFRMGMLQGNYREIDAELASHALQDMLSGLVRRAIETGDSFSEAGENAVELLERGIKRGG
jgi:AcrR family transcriptional regulator